MDKSTLLSKMSQELQALADRIKREGYPTFDGNDHLPLIKAGLVKYNNYVREFRESNSSESFEGAMKTHKGIMGIYNIALQNKARFLYFPTIS